MRGAQGSDTAKRGLIDKITGMFKKATPEWLANLLTTERQTFRIADAEIFDLGRARLSKYSDYDRMDMEMVELSSAVDLYADWVTQSGSEAGEVFMLELPGGGKERERKIVKALDNRLELKERVWFIARNTGKYGDAFYELVASKLMIIKLIHLPCKEMFINYDEAGKIDRDIPYYQKESSTDKQIAQFAPWEIVHFKIGEEDYGVNYSIFSKLRRTFRVQKMLEDSMVITRMTRANQQGVYYVDCSGMTEREATRYLRRVKLINRRKRYFDTEGKLKTKFNPLAENEDLYIPVRKGSGDKFEKIGGERHLGDIKDIEHFHNKLFAATKVPKAFLGYERDVNAKATLVQQNIAFTRAIKRQRFALARGLKKIYRVEFICNGIDPEALDMQIRFPALGEADEEAKWTIAKLRAETTKIYGEIGLQLPVEWIVRKMLDLTTVEADELIALLGVEGGEPTTTPPVKPISKDKPPPEKPKSPSLHPDKDKATDKDKQTKKPGESEFIGEISDSELEAILVKVQADTHLRAIIKAAETAIKSNVGTRRYEVY